MSNFVDFESRSDLVKSTAGIIADALRAAIAERGNAKIALSGGSTPGPIYEALSGYGAVEWDKVDVTLADERLTPPGHPDSNESLVRKTLMKNHAAGARFLPLNEDAATLPRQDVIVLGMGGDGHFASLFPNAPQLRDALRPGAPPVLRMVPDPLPDNAPYQRLTLSLATILDAEQLILVVTGDDKRAVLTRASKEEGPVEDLPIRALLRAEHPNLLIHWAP